MATTKAAAKSGEMAAYFDDLGRRHTLTPEEATALGRIARDPGRTDAERHDARRRLVEGNLRLVVHLAKIRRDRPMDDLISEGNLGLIRAADKYDPSFGTPFGAYASKWIRSFQGKRRRGDRPTSSLPEGLDEADHRRDERSSPDDVDQVRRLLSQMPAGYAAVLRRSFGLHGGDEQTPAEIADERGVSRQLIGEIRRRALFMGRCLIDGVPAPIARRLAGSLRPTKAGSRGGATAADADAADREGDREDAYDALDAPLPDDFDFPDDCPGDPDDPDENAADIARTYDRAATATETPS